MDLISQDDIDDLRNAPQESIQAKGQFLLKRLSSRANAYERVLELPSLPNAEAEAYGRRWSEWAQRRNDWQGQFTRTLSQKKAKEAANLLEQGVTLFDEIEEILRNEAPSGYAFREQGTRAALDAILEELERARRATTTQVTNLREDLTARVDAEIAKVLDLKRELQVSGNFVEAVEAQAKSAHAARVIWGGLLVVGLFAVCVGAFLSLDDKMSTTAIIRRVSVGVPAALLLSFFYVRFQVNTLLHLRYQHMTNLLRGGISTISQVLPDDEGRRRMLSEVTSMLVSQDAEFDAVRKTKSPSEKLLLEAMRSDLVRHSRPEK